MKPELNHAIYTVINTFLDIKSRVDEDIDDRWPDFADFAEKVNNLHKIWSETISAKELISLLKTQTKKK